MQTPPFDEGNCIRGRDIKQALCDRVITRVFILQPTFSDVLPPCFHLLRRSKSLNQTLAGHVAFSTRLSPFGYQECPVVTQTAALRTVVAEREERPRLTVLHVGCQ